MTSFSKQLVEEMFENNVRFEKILHIPTLCVSTNDRISDDFQTFLEAAYEKPQNDFLLAQCPEMASTLNEIRENDFIVEFSQDVARDLQKEASAFEFLVMTETRCSTNFIFKENGEVDSFTLGNWYSTQWMLAKSMTHAAELAIKEAISERDEEIQKAKIKQGLVSV